MLTTDLYHKIVVNSPFGFALHSLILDEDGREIDLVFREVNAAFEALTGYSRDELMGESALQLFKTTSPVLDETYHEQIFRKGDVMVDFYNPDTDSWYNVRSFRVESSMVVSLFVDVTAHKGKAEELEHFFQVNLDMFSVSDVHGNFIKLNKRWEQTLGYSIQQLEQICYLDLIHPDDLESTRKILADLDQQKEVRSFVNRYRTINGEYRFIEWHCMPNGSFVFSSSRDITDQLMVTRQLAYNEQLYRGLLESQNDLIVRVDKEYCITYLNDVYCSTFGVNKDELTGSHMFVQIDEKDRPNALKFLAQLADPPHRLQLVQHASTFTGLRWISWAISAIYDENHSLMEIMAVGRDITDIKLKEEKLESQEKFRQIVDNIGGVFWLLSADKKNLLFVNSEFKRFYGHDFEFADDPVQLLRAMVYASDLNRFEKSVSQFMEKGKVNAEFRINHPDRKIHWLNVSVFPVLDEKGIVQSYAGHFQDITERKNIEWSEAEKSRRISAIVQAMPDLMFVIKADGEYLDVITNDPADMIMPPEQIIGKNIRDIFLDKADNLLACIQESISLKKVVTTTYQLEVEGRMMHFEARITPLGDDSILSVVRNVTELYTTAERLRFQTRLQQLLIKISNTYINLPVDDLDSTLNASLQELGEFIGADRFYVFDYLSEKHAFYNTHEWCSPAVIPQIEYLQGTPADEMEPFLSNHMKGEMMVIYDVLALPADSTVRAVLEPQDIKSIITVPLIDNGEYVGFIGIDSVHTHKHFDEDEKQLLQVFAQTLTAARQRIRSQKELEAALEKSKESDRLKSAFLATMSHELRTPLNHIMGFSELIRMVSQEDTIRDYANDINASGRGLLEMIEDVFSIALAEKSVMKLRLSSMKGVELFLSSKNTLQEMLMNTGKSETIRLVFKPDPELMSLFFVSDRQKIQQVLSNLFSNAVKFTENGSIEFGMTGVGTFIEFYVRDTGIGIDPGNQDYIFELFRQLDDSYSRRYEGLGIGLSIAQKLAEVLGATIRVESAPGQGSCFFFKVPVEIV